ncbi:MAG: hypothetical protein H7Z17_20900 [Fuerstia sp.]|nr:hypothetical protein [Fuerstiella sp.]
MQEIIKQVRQSGVVDFESSHLFHLLRTVNVAFFFDGLDQLPSSHEGADILNAVLTFASNVFVRQDSKAMAVLVMRSEFYKTSPKCQELVSKNKIPLVQVIGFTEEAQKERYLLAADKAQGGIRWQKLKELTAGNSDLHDLFVRPLLLQRFSTIDFTRVRSLVPTGVTLAEVYRLSFDSLESTVREAAINFGYRLYSLDTYLDDTPHGRSTECADQESIQDLVSCGILVRGERILRFSHATFRDYFAAESILKRIKSSNAELVLKDRVIHYLVAEFVAGLLDDKALSLLFTAIDAIGEGWVRYNGMDILSEIVDHETHKLAEEFIRERVSRLNFGTDHLNEYKMFLGTIAGTYGMLEPINYVMRQLDRLGPMEFLEKYFYTRDHFVYYGNSIDRCFWEWIDQLATRKHAYFRLVCIRLMSDLGFRPALQTLEKIVQNKNDDALVREFAADAIQKLSDVG